MLRRLAPEQCAAGDAAALGDAAHDVGDALGEHRAGCDVVGHEERLGAADDEVVDDHRDEVDADRVVDVEGLRDRDLRPDTIGRGGEQRPAVSGERGGVEEAA